MVLMVIDGDVRCDRTGSSFWSFRGGCGSGRVAGMACGTGKSRLAGTVFRMDGVVGTIEEVETEIEEEEEEEDTVADKFGGYGADEYLALDL